MRASDTDVIRRPSGRPGNISGKVIPIASSEDMSLADANH